MAFFMKRYKVAAAPSPSGNYVVNDLIGALNMPSAGFSYFGTSIDSTSTPKVFSKLYNYPRLPLLSDAQVTANNIVKLSTLLGQTSTIREDTIIFCDEVSLTGISSAVAEKYTKFFKGSLQQGTGDSYMYSGTLTLEVFVNGFENYGDTYELVKEFYYSYSTSDITISGYDKDSYCHGYGVKTLELVIAPYSKNIADGLTTYSWDPTGENQSRDNVDILANVCSFIKEGYAEGSGYDVSENIFDTNQLRSFLCTRMKNPTNETKADLHFLLSIGNSDNDYLSLTPDSQNLESAYQYYVPARYSEDPMWLQVGVNINIPNEFNQQIFSSVLPNQNYWGTVSFVIDTDNTTIYMYVNGVLKETFTDEDGYYYSEAFNIFPYISHLTGTYNTRNGDYSSGDDNNFYAPYGETYTDTDGQTITSGGSVTDQYVLGVRLYSTALTAAQIQQNYNKDYSRWGTNGTDV